MKKKDGRLPKNNRQTDDGFVPLTDVIRLARREHRVEFLDLDHDHPIDTDRLLRTVQHNRVAQQFLCCRIRYLDGSTAGPAHSDKETDSPPHEGLFVYVQMALTGGEEVDLKQFRKSHPNFPDEPIANQFFNSSQVESYRQLGYEIASKVCKELPTAMDQGVRWCSSKRLTTAQIANRIRLAYLWECWHEIGVDRFDIRPASIVAEVDAEVVPRQEGKSKQECDGVMCCGQARFTRNSEAVGGYDAQASIPAARCCKGFPLCECRGVRAKRPSKPSNAHRAC